MEQSEILIRILLTVVFGAILGLETETREIEKKGKTKAKKDEKSRIGGIRTYTVLALIGGVSGILFSNNEYVLSYITFFGIISLVVSAYIQNIKLKEAFGLTTEIAILITYLIGFLTTSGMVPISVNLVILVLLTFFLSQKRGLGKLVEQIQHEELIDLTKFGLISAVVLPILPNRNFSIADIIAALNLGTLSLKQELLNIIIINPFRMWMIVVVITGIDLVGYILSKAIGKNKGILLTSIFGGLISSTSTTIALASKSKKDEKDNSNLYVGSALVSTAVSFITVSLLITILNLNLFKELYVPIISMFIIGLVVGFVFILTNKNKGKSNIELKHQALSIKPAIKFVLMIIIITLLIQVLELFNNQTLLVGVTAISGFTGIDAPSIAITELINSGTITLTLGALMFLLTNAMNLFAKVIYALMQGDKRFAWKLALGLGIVLCGSLMIFVT